MTLGVTSAQLGRVQEAIGHWRQALQIKPDYAEAHYNLGYVLVDQGQTTEAVEHYQKALDSAGKRGNTALANAARTRLDHYKADSVYTAKP